MKTKLAGVLLAASLVAQMGVACFAEDGPWTTNHPYAWGLTSLPFRLASAGVGVGLGAVTGSVTGIIDTEKKFSEKTFAKVPENPMMFPVGLVGSVVAVPVGVLKGAPPEAVDMGKQGYNWWNRF